MNNLNNTLLNDGVLSGIAATDTDSQSEIIAAKNDAANSHLKYADTDAQGYALMSLSENMLNVSLVTIAGMNQDTGKRSPGTNDLRNSQCLPALSQGEWMSPSPAKFPLSCPPLIKTPVLYAC